MPPEIFSFSSPLVEFVLKRQDSRLCLDQCHLSGDSGEALLSTSELFAIHVNGARFSARELAFISGRWDRSSVGMDYFQAFFEGSGFTVTLHLKLYADTALLEIWPEITRTGSHPIKIERIDSFSFDLPASHAELLSFDSDWSAEFQPNRRPLAGTILLETRLGRSSKGMHPWFALFQENGSVFSGSVAWSGNWIMRFEPLENGSYRVCGGLNDWNFTKELTPSERMEGPHGIWAFAKDLNGVSQQYARVGRQYWYPSNALSCQLPVEWNHWWSYEDVDIDAGKFTQNVEMAAGLGIEVCTLDAGWFGPSAAASDWQDYRGDWELVNRQRFPSGIRPLSDLAHSRGMHFGLWCEIEGLGKKALIRGSRPDLLAIRDGEPLGYVCLGNPDVMEWAYRTLSRLITEYRCDWIKLDFNVDPQAGCNRTDHGHGSGDGLFEHYRGYYRLLERIGLAFPEVVLENCSSGGLRIDLGMMRHTHLTFLSDPDWPVHALQVFWGASTMLAPAACLHWSFSEWRSQNLPEQQIFDPRSPTLQPHQVDYYTRIAMLGAFGMSQKLPDAPAWVLQRWAYHFDIYRRHVRRFVNQSDLYRLTDQPRRDATGERWCAFQYSLSDRSQHLLFVFRLPGAELQKVIRLVGLQPERYYPITDIDGAAEKGKTGCELMETGLLFSSLPEEGSRLLLIG